jgi:molybdopterin-synthase adenylyltransferase
MSSMKDFYIAITSTDWERLRNALLPVDGKESAAVLLCGVSDTEPEYRLLVRKIMEVPTDLYEARNEHHLEVSPHFYNQVITECTRSKLTPVIIHSHQFEGDAWYSHSDDYGESRLLPVLASLLPATTPASLVITKTSVTGRRFLEDKFTPITGLKIFGRKTRIVEFNKNRGLPIDSQFDRQVRAFGETGQRLLQKIKVGIIGAGGIGSLVVEQLARVGIQDLIIIDNDVIEPSNVSRILGSNLNDVGRMKAEVVGTHAKLLGVNKVLPINESAIRQDVLLELRDRDIIFNCVDNDRSRAIINRFSYQYLIPVIDLGTRLDGRGGEITAAAGRVSLIGSGMTCLRCSHHLNPERIRAESMPASERQTLEREGYVMGIDEPVPAVISVNSVVAGLGVTAGLNLVVGLTGKVQPPGQIYDAGTGSVFAIQDVHEPGCDVCDENLGVKAFGDTQIVSAY